MNRILKILLIIAIFAAFFHFRFELGKKFQPYILNIKEKLQIASGSGPCAKPIAYTLGTFDERFNISKDYFLDALKEAEAAWEKSQGSYSGKNLFVYAPEGLPLNRDALKVNLVYDYRQEATSKLASLGIVVKNTKASYESLKSKLEILKTEYEREKNYFNSRVASFNQKQLVYEKSVKYWNGKGGAPQQEYNRLQATRFALEAEARQIQILQNNLNAKAGEINALVVVLNRLITSLNLSVEKYNTVNESRGESFEEGVYTTDGTNSQIDIFEFSSREKLVRVLMHEFGHALGIEHLDDPKAIMYKLNQGENLELTEADIEALKAKCALK